jgi:Phosphotransferase enzyme family
MALTRTRCGLDTWLKPGAGPDNPYRDRAAGLDTWRMPGDSADRFAEMTRAGLAAAVGVAREHGLPADDPEILSSRGNVLVHLRPAPVVARVATLTAWTRREPLQWLAREVTIAGYAAANGGPAVPPTALADPGPHWRDGLAVSLWTFVPPSPRRPAPAEFGVALARLHLATAGFPGDLPVLTTLRAQISDALAALERERVLDPGVLTALRDRHAEILAALDGLAGPELVLHGDAHPGNLLWTPAGWLWTDLEETCRGPRAFDLAVLVRGQGADDAATALAAYANVTGEPLPGTAELAWFDWARALEGAVWILAMAHQHPARYAGQAPGVLAGVLAARQPSPGPGPRRSMGL